ncbi:hypothetical protein FC54_GL001662 [Ligilactobacillus saerimneri DSM 16049]|nr:hypothetical protein FC54_GL001662 [Ligilactobacillus saerimneri DSM 16049]
MHNFSLLIKKLIHLGISFSNHFLLVTNLNISLKTLFISMLKAYLVAIWLQFIRRLVFG